MSSALPGERYCRVHQGNTSIYDPKNCTLCGIQKALADVHAILRRDELLPSVRVEKASAILSKVRRTNDHPHHRR